MTGACCWLLLLLFLPVVEGLSKKVYLEADKNCGQTHKLDSGEIIIIGSKRGRSINLLEQCDITFTSVSEDDQDKVCMEIEELEFQGNCYASLSLYDIIPNNGFRQKQLGHFDCRNVPPMEVCSDGRTLRMNLNRGYVSFHRDLVLFLLQVYTKNPDAPLEDRVKEVPGVFHQADTYVIIFIVIAAVVILVLISLVAIVIVCMRHKSTRRARRAGSASGPILANTQPAHTLHTAVARPDLKTGNTGSQEYYPLRPIPQRHYIGQRYAHYAYPTYTDQCWGNEEEGYPSSALTTSITGTQSTPVSSYYQTYSLQDHPATCQCYSYPNDGLQADNYATDGYASERYSGDYEHYSGDGYHSDSYLNERYPSHSYSLARLPPHGVLRGYTGYPGVTHPLVSGICYGSNMGYRQGEEDADQSDVSDNDMDTSKPNPKQEDEDPKDSSKPEEDDDDQAYQEVGPPQFKHVTFM